MQAPRATPVLIPCHAAPEQQAAIAQVYDVFQLPPLLSLHMQVGGQVRSRAEQMGRDGRGRAG